MLNKKGESSPKAMILWAVGIVILVQALIQVFGDSGLGSSNWTDTAPTMLVAIFPLAIVAAVVAFVIK